MIRKNQPRPLYREVLRDAFFTAWQERKLWVFALFAGILQTGGMYDVIFRSAKLITQQGRAILSSPNWGWEMMHPGGALSFWRFDGPLSLAGFFERFLFASVLVLALLALSVIAQGALTYGLGTRVRGRAPSLRACLTVGAHHILPIAFLNLFTLGLVWLMRFIVATVLALALSTTSFLSVFTYCAAFLLFLFGTFVLTTVHMFALNIIILEKTSLWHGIVHGYRLFKKSWLVILETGALLFVFGISIFVASFFLFFIAGLPILLLLVSFMILPTPGLFWLTFLIGIALFFTITIGAGVFSITFQYDAWQRLYQRVDSGSAHAKLHRVLDWFLNLLPSRL